MSELLRIALPSSEVLLKALPVSPPPLESKPQSRISGLGLGTRPPPTEKVLETPLPTRVPLPQPLPLAKGCSSRAAGRHTEPAKVPVMQVPPAGFRSTSWLSSDARSNSCTSAGASAKETPRALIGAPPGANRTAAELRAKRESVTPPPPHTAFCCCLLGVRVCCSMWRALTPVPAVV